MSYLPELAVDLARSPKLPARAAVGVRSTCPLTFAVSGPLTDPLELLGFRAPASWTALGIVADVGGQGPLRRVAWLVGADGAVGSATGPAHRSRSPIEPFVEGLMADIARRCLGLATPPPTVPASVVDELVYLDLAVAQAAAGTLDLAVAPAAAGGLDLAVAQAAAGTLDLSSARRRGVAAVDARAPRHDGDVDTSGSDHADGSSAGWHALHRRTVAAADPACRSRLRRMDVGLFSRWVMGMWPAVDELVATLGDLVGDSVVAAVLDRCPTVRALAGGGPIGCHWPAAGDITTIDVDTIGA